MAKVITQIYGCEQIIDAQIAAALGADHIGCGFGEVKHLGPQQKNCAQAKEFFDALSSRFTARRQFVRPLIVSTLSLPFLIQWPYYTFFFAPLQYKR